MRVTNLEQCPVCTKSFTPEEVIDPAITIVVDGRIVHKDCAAK